MLIDKAHFRPVIYTHIHIYTEIDAKQNTFTHRPQFDNVIRKK